MQHADLAHVAAVAGAAGSVAILAARTRASLLTGFLLLAVAEVLLAVALVPGHDLRRLESGKAAAALVVAGLLVLALTYVLVRYPAWTAPVLLVAAPFRISVHLGTQHAFLLLPLYAVLAGATLAFLVRVVRTRDVGSVPPILAAGAGGFIALDAVSLLWSKDVQQGSIELLFFLFPFAALVRTVVASPFPRWQPRVLAGVLIGLTSIFALIGLYQRATHTLFYAPSLEAENAYTSYFRVSAVFKDPSLYGRYLAIGIVVVLTAVLFARLRIAYAIGIVALLSAGLWFSYSQSSMVALFVVAAAVAVVAGDRPTRRAVAVAAAVIVIGATAFVAVRETKASARRVTSDRSRLVSVTWTVFKNHPLAGVGVGGQPRASQQEASKRSLTSRDRSHTTPLTVAAELGVVGFAVYVFLLFAAARVLRDAYRRDAAIGVGLGAVFLVLFVHSLFYAGFFEDPLTWGSLAAAAALTLQRRSGPLLTDALRPRPTGADGTLDRPREPIPSKPART